MNAQIPHLTPLLDMVLPGFDPADASASALAPVDQLANRGLATRLHLSIDTRQYAAAGVLFAEDAELDFQWSHMRDRDAITAGGGWRITRMVQDQTAIDPALAPADAVAYTALTAPDRARHDGRAA